MNVSFFFLTLKNNLFSSGEGFFKCLTETETIRQIQQKVSGVAETLPNQK